MLDRGVPGRPDAVDAAWTPLAALPRTGVWGRQVHPSLYPKGLTLRNHV